MRIVFENNESVEINLSGQLKKIYENIYRHLQHIDLEPHHWDNPFHKSDAEMDFLRAANTLRIAIDHSRLYQSQYHNHLHTIYEQNYNGSRDWLVYHEALHNLTNPKEPILFVDYREKAGPLIPRFNLDWLEDSCTTVTRGQIFVEWSELGKTPFTYWANNEPDDDQRLCELAKPWINLHPKLCIAFDHIDRLANIDQQSFNAWWDTKQEFWCKYYQLPSWPLHYQRAMIYLGQVNDIDRLETLLKVSNIRRIVL